MSDTTQTPSQGVDALIQPGPQANGGAQVQTGSSGEPNDKKGVDSKDYKNDYEELSRKFGEQSEEVGDLRNFVKVVTPLIEKLESQPEVIEAIMAGKIDKNLAQSVMEGKVKIEDATQVADAHAQVKKELGKEQYDKTSPAQIEELIMKKVEEKVGQVVDRLTKSEQNLNKALTESEERREFENKTNNFIKNTTDYQDYAVDIDKWFDEHPEQFDIEIAYHAVKGKKYTQQSIKEAEEKAAEEAKNFAANAGGGQSQGSSIVRDQNIIDSLISSHKNPNS